MRVCESYTFHLRGMRAAGAFARFFQSKKNMTEVKADREYLQRVLSFSSKLDGRRLTMLGHRRHENYGLQRSVLDQLGCPASYTAEHLPNGPLQSVH